MEVAPNQGGTSWALATADGDRFTLTLPAGELGAKLSRTDWMDGAIRHLNFMAGKAKEGPLLAAPLLLSENFSY